MLKKLDHVIMVVNNLETAVKAYEKILHLTPEGGSIREVNDLRIAMLPTKLGSRIELIEPKETSRNRHAEFLKKRGEGVFGLSAFISDFEAEVKSLRAEGVTVIEESQPSVHPGYSLRLGWIPPEEAGGVWIELVDVESLPPHLQKDL
jgi:catechol 2,3-dioxygenase-like lactoylglutathione lyase family enzyme